MAVYVFTRNGTVKTIRPGWVITESANGRNRMDFSVHSLDGSVRYVNDDEIVFTEDGTRIFGGLIDKPSEVALDGYGGSAAIIQRLSAVDFNVYPSRLTIATETTRPAETLKARLTWIAGLMTDFGVTIDAAQVDGPTLLTRTFSVGQYLVDVLNQTVAEASGTGATSWVWEVDYTKVLRAFQSGSQAAPFSLVDGDRNALGDITVEQPRPSNYANYIVLMAGIGQRYIDFERHDGDGVVRRWALNVPVASLVGALRIDGGAGGYPVGIYGTDDLPWTFDNSTNEIVQRSDQTLIAIGHYIEMSYNGQYPVRVTADGGLPAAQRVTATYQEPDIFDVAVAQAVANSYLTRDMVSPKTVQYAATYSKTGLHPGQTQTITSTKRNLSGTHLITDVVIRHITANYVGRFVTAVSTQRLPSTLREKFRQTFGAGSASGSSASQITVVTGGTVLSSPASLGGSDVQWIACDTPARVRNPQPYDAPASIAVTVQGLVSARSAINVTPILWDETDAAAEFSGTPVACSATPAPFSVNGMITAGHRYWLYVQSGTAGVSASAVGQIVS